MRNLWLPLAWLVLVALLPWWLGLPLLLSLAGVAVLLQRQLGSADLQRLRRALRWGLPGLLMVIVRALGGNAFAWVVALVAALAGFTVLAGVEAWLDRDARRAPAAPEDTEWPELARAPIGPTARIIELQPPNWSATTRGLIDPRGERLVFHHNSFHFDDGSVIEDVDDEAGFSTDGDWFFARMTNGGGIVLWDRQRDRQHRWRGWDLCGWYGVEPWLISGDDGVPQKFSMLPRDAGD